MTASTPISVTKFVSPLVISFVSLTLRQNCYRAGTGLWLRLPTIQSMRSVNIRDRGIGMVHIMTQRTVTVLRANINLACGARSIACMPGILGTPCI